MHFGVQADGNFLYSNEKESLIYIILNLAHCLVTYYLYIIFPYTALSNVNIQDLQDLQDLRDLQVLQVLQAFGVQKEQEVLQVNEDHQVLQVNKDHQVLQVNKDRQV